MRGPAKLATYLAVAMTLAGFSTIFLAWNGAAGFDRMPQQFPYLLSGGMTGIGLVVGGMAVMGIQTARQLSAERARQMEQVTDAMAGLVASVRTHGTGRVPAAADATTDGHGAVVAGRSSFHASTCHLVAARGDLPHLSVRDAERRGLAPCRVCKPLLAHRG